MPIIKTVNKALHKLAAAWRRWHFFTINLNALELTENFMIAAVSAIVLIRVFLSLFSYPQIGSGEWHIAHMLWGGLLMAVALFLTLIYLNKEAKHLAAIIGGLGFGIFIDELGKFITSDYNYFYQPVIALIYLILVGLFLGLKQVFGQHKPNKFDFTLNAIEILKEVARSDLDWQEKAKAIAYLEKADRRQTLVKGLVSILHKNPAKSDTEAQFIASIKNYFLRRYASLVKHPFFARVISGSFVIISLVNLALAWHRWEPGWLNFWEWGSLATTVLSASYLLLGIFYLRKKHRPPAYTHFRHAVLVQIFLGQFFLFYSRQLAAGLNLLMMISVYTALQWLTEQEKSLKVWRQQ